MDEKEIRTFERLLKLLENLLYANAKARGLHGGVSVSVNPDGTHTSRLLTEEELDKLEKTKPAGRIVGSVDDAAEFISKTAAAPDKDTIAKMLQDAINKSFDKTKMKQYIPGVGLTDPYNRPRYNIMAANRLPDNLNPAERELMKASEDFIASFKSEAIEKFMKEHFYGHNHRNYHIAEKQGIKIIPFVIELVSHVGDGARTAANMNHFFNEMSQNDQLQTMVILASIGFAAMARAAGHEDWVNDVYRK